jgi:hypothetical protein
MQHPDVTLIFTHALNAARDYLEAGGTIPVFAYVLAAVGQDQLRRIVPKPGTGQPAHEVVHQLRAILRDEARVEGYHAVAIISAERMDGSGNGSSAPVLQVALDHLAAGPFVWHVPFHRMGERYEFGTRDGGGILKAGERFIFPE